MSKSRKTVPSKKNQPTPQKAGLSGRNKAVAKGRKKSLLRPASQKAAVNLKDRHDGHNESDTSKFQDVFAEIHQIIASKKYKSQDPSKFLADKGFYKWEIVMPGVTVLPKKGSKIEIPIDDDNVTLRLWMKGHNHFTKNDSKNSYVPWIEVRKSGAGADAGLGVYAARTFREGTTVGFYLGKRDNGKHPKSKKAGGSNNYRLGCWSAGGSYGHNLGMGMHLINDSSFQFPAIQEGNNGGSLQVATLRKKAKSLNLLRFEMYDGVARVVVKPGKKILPGMEMTVDYDGDE